MFSSFFCSGSLRNMLTSTTQIDPGDFVVDYVVFSSCRFLRNHSTAPLLRLSTVHTQLLSELPSCSHCSTDLSLSATVLSLLISASLSASLSLLLSLCCSLSALSFCYSLCYSLSLCYLLLSLLMLSLSALLSALTSALCSH